MIIWSTDILAARTEQDTELKHCWADFRWIKPVHGKMELDKTLSWMKIYTEYAYLWAMIPFRFNSWNKNLVMSKSSAHSLRYVTTMGIILLSRFVVVVFLIRDILNHNLKLEDKFGTLHVGVILVSFYCIGNHLSSFWNGPEIVSTVNSFLLFYKDFERKLIPIASPLNYLYFFNSSR